MYPNDQQPTTIPTDYLDQIAPKTTKKPTGILGKLIIIVGIIVVVFAIFMAATSLISSIINPNERLAARLLSTKGILDDAITKTRNSQLRTYNETLEAYLSDTIKTFSPLLTKQDVDINNLTKKITALESNSLTLNKLKNAQLNATYDRTYAREMAYKLDTVIILIKDLQKGSNNETMKTFLENSLNDLEPIQAQFADFNAANS